LCATYPRWFGNGINLVGTPASKAKTCGNISALARRRLQTSLTVRVVTARCETRAGRQSRLWRTGLPWHNLTRLPAAPGSTMAWAPERGSS
jgi:hypothetical protein